MNYPLTAEQELIIGSLRRFREEELEPHEAEVDRSGEVPEELGRQIEVRARPELSRRQVLERLAAVEGVYACGDMGRGQSLIVWAIAEGHTDVAAELIRRDADVSNRSSGSWTPTP